MKVTIKLYTFIILNFYFLNAYSQIITQYETKYGSIESSLIYKNMSVFETDSLRKILSKKSSEIIFCIAINNNNINVDECKDYYFEGYCAFKIIEKRNKLIAADLVVLGQINSYFNYTSNSILYYSKALKYPLDSIEWPTETMVHLLRGKEYLKTNKYENSIYDFTKAINVSKKIKLQNDFFTINDLSESYFYRGEANEKLGNFSGLNNDLDSCIIINKFHHEALFKRGLIKIENQDFESAFIDINAAISHSKNIKKYFFYRGYLYYYYYKSFDLAEADFSKTIEIGYDEKAYYYRANTYLRQEKYHLAIKDLSVLISKNQFDANYYELRGLAKLSASDYRGSILDFDNAIKINPKNAEYHYYKGAAYGELKQNKEAIINLNNAIKLNNNDGSYFYERGRYKLLAMDTNGGCIDMSKAGELGFADAYKIIEKYCK